MIEAHAHIAHHGRTMRMIDLASCPDRGDMIDRLASAHEPGWVLGFGARPDAWPEPRWPTAAELDRAVGDRPCAAWCFDAHTLVANSLAMQAAGIEPGTTIDRGVIERDTSGKATGVMREAAAQHVWNAVPEPSPAQQTADVRAALADLAALGYTEVHDLKSDLWLGPVLAGLESAGDLPVAVTVFPMIDDLEEAVRGRPAWESGRVRLGGGKIFTDGTINSRTAWMLEPFADGMPDYPCGTPMMSSDAIEQAVRLADGLGLPLAAHAIGDAAVRAVLDAIERAHPTTTGWRIEHLELVHEADIPRFAQLGVTASVQPCHLLTDIEALQRSVPDRLGRVLPLRDLIDAGCEPGVGLIFGSDVPIVPANPKDSIRAAVTRRRKGMDGTESIAPSQAISKAEAWACFGSTRE